MLGPPPGPRIRSGISAPVSGKDAPSDHENEQHDNSDANSSERKQPDDEALDFPMSDGDSDIEIEPPIQNGPMEKDDESSDLEIV